MSFHLSPTEGRWRWTDGTEMAMPTSSWNEWYEGEPDNGDGVEHCAVMSNYKYWALWKSMLGAYVWRDFSCLYNNNNIQGYICERNNSCKLCSSVINIVILALPPVECQIMLSQCLTNPMAMPLAVVRYWVEYAVSIMGQTSRCCMVCLMPQSQVSGSLDLVPLNITHNILKPWSCVEVQINKSLYSLWR